VTSISVNQNDLLSISVKPLQKFFWKELLDDINRVWRVAKHWWNSYLNFLLLICALWMGLRTFSIAFVRGTIWIDLWSATEITWGVAWYCQMLFSVLC